MPPDPRRTFLFLNQLQILVLKENRFVTGFGAWSEPPREISGPGAEILFGSFGQWSPKIK